MLCLLGIAPGAARLAAQQGTAPRTITIKKGDTLWDIARQVLGDPFLWPEIYRLNTATIEDPHWIYPGAELRLPGGGSMPRAAAPEAAPPEPSIARPVAATRRSGGGMTIFNPLTRRVQKQTRESLILGARITAVRPGEYLTSPFMWAVGGPTDAGRVELTAETQGIGMTLANRPIQIREPVFITLPKGSRGDVGERLLLYRLGDVVGEQGQVVVPTGVVRVLAPPTGGISPAELVQKFEDVFTGQGAMALDTLRMPLNQFPRRVTMGPVTEVSWLYLHPLLATTSHYLILGIGASDGIVPGDQVSLYREHLSPVDGSVLTSEELGIAQVTRVTRWGASAIIIQQEQVGIAEGMRARISAKMP